jgi:hypothetical protein
VTRARLGGLVGLPFALLVAWAWAATAVAQETDPAGRHAVVVLVPGASFEELLSVPEVAELAHHGGAALLSTSAPVGELVAGEIPSSALSPSTASLDEVGAELAAAVAAAPPGETLVVVAGTGPSASMRADKDELLPVVLARGEAGELLGSSGGLRSLTSDSTRRSGVVVGQDVVATLTDFLGIPGGADGSVIRVTSDPAPLALHERYLAQRRMYVPVGTAAALYATVVGLAGIGCLAARRRVPAAWQRVAGWACLSIPMLATGMLAVGHLSELSYATAVPMIAIVAVLGTMAFSPLARSDPTLVPAGIGAAVLGLAVLEWLSGWSGLLTPLLGGSQLDGGRFYGLPNVAIGLVVGSALWVAQRLRTGAGFALLCALGLFAGLPSIGADFGGAVTAFAAAGMWVGVRERERLGAWAGVGLAAAVTLVGTAVILVAHAVSPVATHVTRFEENVSGVTGVVERFVDRLQVGFDLIARSPAAIIPVVGLPVLVFFVLRPPASVRPSFEARPAWRDAVLVAALAGIVAYVVNDSGPAAAGFAFGLALGGMLGVSLLSSDATMPAMMGER